MNSILAVEKGLPPGLWLPTAEEDTTQYLKENFNHNDHDYEDIVDFGAFTVALALLGQEETGRVSLMPKQADFVALFKAGYGVYPGRMRKYYGGEAKLQRALGFFPDGYKPTQDEILERMEWMAQYSLDPSAEFGRDRNFSVAKILEWGARRDLLPAVEMTREVLGEKTGEINRIFNIESTKAPRYLTYGKMYKLGAKIIRDHGGPISQKQLDTLYADEFLEAP